MTTTPETTTTVHVDVPINLPLEGGGVQTVCHGIKGIRTQTEGLVVFPVLIGPYDIDESRWSVTHVGTGLRIPVAFGSKEQATGFANAAGPLALWWQKFPELSSDTQVALIELAQEHGGTPDQRVLDVLARRAAKDGDE
jgi:hypothetical protein